MSPAIAAIGARLEFNPRGNRGEICTHEELLAKGNRGRTTIFWPNFLVNTEF
jgi:hypothetical protein